MVMLAPRSKIGPKERALREARAEGRHSDIAASISGSRPADVTVKNSAAPEVPAETEKKDSVMRSNSSKTTAKANARKAVKAKTTKTKESKSDVVERMLLASNGTTRELLSKATKWDYVNLTVAAKRAGKKLWERDGRVGLE